MAGEIPTHRAKERRCARNIGALLLLFLVVLGRSEGQTYCGPRTVIIVVDPAIVSAIRGGLDQFERDLCLASYGVVEHSSGFADAPGLRTYLADQYLQSGAAVEGAILIGALPHAYQWVTTHGVYPTAEEAIAFQYYSDLDGVFAKSASYTSPGGHPASYDVHEGNVDWEIWIGVLPMYNGDLQQSIAAINRYFAKNHAYRTGQLTRPAVFLEVSEHYNATTTADHEVYMNAMRTGPYSWTPYSDSSDARLYFNSITGLSVQQGYADLQNGLADFTVQDSHGYWGTAGLLTIAIVESTPVRTLFYWSNGCAVGNLDQPRNVLTSFLYSPTSDVLVAKGTTNNSGGMGNNENGFFGHNVATALAAGESFGKALVGHVNVPLLWPWSQDREFHFGTAILLGDPTLRHRFDNAPRYQLTVGSLGLAHIESEPRGIDCGRVCEHHFLAGTQVTLAATGRDGYAFNGWTGACSGQDSCTVTMNEDAVVMGMFTGPTTPAVSLALSRPSRIGRAEQRSVVASNARAVDWKLSLKPLRVGATAELSCEAPAGVNCEVSPKRVEQMGENEIEITVSVSAERDALAGEGTATVRANSDRATTSIDLRFQIIHPLR